MNCRPLIPWLLFALTAAAQDPQDLLRFTNGDQLRGQFLGLKQGPQVIWRNDDLAAAAEFKTTRIRQIVLRGGRPLKPLATLSHLGLVNGDRMPGSVTAMDEHTLTLETPYAGTLTIARDQVSILAANPLGGRVHYQGPFAEDEWQMLHPSFPDGFPPAAGNDAEKEQAEPPGIWTFSGSAWYWQSKRGGTTLVRKSGMPERSVLRFDLAWRSRLNLAVVFHADFTPLPPEGEKKEKNKRPFNPMDTSNLPRVLGNSYVLQLFSNYLTLFRTTVDAAGNPGLIRDHRNSNSLRLGDSGQARIELRSNRRTGEISLFVNDEFAAQWNGMELPEDDADAPAPAPPQPGMGTGFGFMVQGDDSPARISDIIVSEWNGMPDSARSLQIEDKDVVLMTNGTDRYAGRVGGLDEQGDIRFEGRHGSFRFPLEDVAEIRFARAGLATAKEPPDDNLMVRFGPIGSLSGQGLSGDANALELLSPIAGRLKLSTESATMIEFNPSTLLIDDWNTDF
jgi:hypothetical protein